MRRALTIATLIGFAGAAVAQTSQWEDHWLIRTWIAGAHAANTGGQDALLIGDSLTESFLWNAITGCWYLNAGMAGATIRTIADRAVEIAASTQPRHVHLMIGTNNLPMAHDYPEWATMSADIDRIIGAFHAVGAKVVVWQIPPITPAAEAAGYDNADRIYINNLLWSRVIAKGTFADFYWAGTWTGADGYAVPGSTDAGGIHFSAATQASRYARLAAWQTTIKNATGVNCK